jgi:hypothetical protein
MEHPCDTQRGQSQCNRSVTYIIRIILLCSRCSLFGFLFLVIVIVVVRIIIRIIVIVIIIVFIIVFVVIIIVITDNRISPIMLDDNLIGLVVFVECQFHAIQGSPVSLGELAIGFLVCESLRHIVFEIGQDSNQGSRHSLRQDGLGLDHVFGEFIEFFLQGVIIVLFHVPPQGLDVAFKGFQCSVFATLDHTDFIVGRVRVAHLHPPIVSLEPAAAAARGARSVAGIVAGIILIGFTVVGSTTSSPESRHNECYLVVAIVIVIVIVLVVRCKQQLPRFKLVLAVVVVAVLATTSTVARCNRTVLVLLLHCFVVWLGRRLVLVVNESSH